MTKKKSLLKNRFLLTSLAAALILSASAFWLNALSAKPILSAGFKAKIVSNPVFRHFIPFYRSLRKFPDIVFFPYFLRNTKLPVYNVYLSFSDISTLNSALPANPFSSNLLNENRVKVKGYFKTDGYKAEVDVRYRGLRDNHWNAFKKSYRIEFPSENRFQGRRALNLVIPYDRQYFIEPLSLYRAEKLGLRVPKVWFSRLKINGQDMGVYLCWEQWSDKWLSRIGLPTDSVIFAEDDGRPGVYVEGSPPLLSPAGIERWKTYTKNSAPPYPQLQTLIEIIHNTNDQDFEKLIPYIVDLPRLYAWDLIRILSGGGHQAPTTNLILLFNTASGRFEFIPFDVGIFDRKEIPAYDDVDLVLLRRIVSITNLAKKRQEFIRSYLTPQNLADDLNFYDSLAKKLKAEFLSDQAKLASNFSFLADIKKQRQLIEDNFRRAFSYLEKKYPAYPSPKETALKLPKEFSRFSEIAYSRQEFINKNPLFKPAGSKTVLLGPGKVILQKTVIVPASLRLVIQPGTEIFMAKDVSIVSYSPVEIRGSKRKPVYIRPLRKGQPWGSFLVLDTDKEKSKITFANIAGGSGTSINGVKSTAMLAFHQSDVEIDNSTFSNSFDDDALNVKYSYVRVEKSYFSNTYSDAVDLDSVLAGSRIVENIFEPPIGKGKEANGGDAIDVSYSFVQIVKNNIKGCGDKGISVGERSQPLIKQNYIEKCQLGVTVKDSSYARVYENIFKNNETAISLYQKKQEFGGAEAVLRGNKFMNNNKTITTDKFSKIYNKAN